MRGSKPFISLRNAYYLVLKKFLSYKHVKRYSLMKKSYKCVQLADYMNNYMDKQPKTIFPVIFKKSPSRTDYGLTKGLAIWNPIIHPGYYSSWTQINDRMLYWMTQAVNDTSTAATTKFLGKGRILFIAQFFPFHNVSTVLTSSNTSTKVGMTEKGGTVYLQPLDACSVT